MRQKPDRRYAAAVCVTAVLAACNAEDDPPLTSPALPLSHGVLVDTICPVDLSPKDTARSRREGIAQLRALERAYRRDPDRRVRSVRELSDQEETRRIEIITVRELAKGHVEFAKSEPGRRNACEKRILGRLEALLQE